MLLKTEEEVFDQLVEADNPFRKLVTIIDFAKLTEPLRVCYSDMGSMGIDVEKGMKALLIQFWEDYSDRQMEKAVRHNMAIRWFCGFGLTEETPDHSYLGKLRKRLGTKNIANLFQQVNDMLASQGLVGNVFTFIDASAIVTKTALWEERDRAIQAGEETLNNTNVTDYVKDKDARWGAKGKNAIWFGYKRHCAVDMRHGIVTKVVTTPANVLDPQVVGSVAPRQGMVFMDKLYDTKQCDLIITAKGCYAATIRKRTNKHKNPDLDRWRSHTRMPFESTFSKMNKRARYRGLTKMTMQCFLQATVHNLKKAVTILPMTMAP
jgi:transposase, IS5 family